jgi:ferrochelatase
LAELAARYQAIGGHSPLYEITQRTGQGLQREMHKRTAGRDIQVYLGMKHSPPFIADAVSAIVAGGVRRVLGLVLAPHFSTMSVGEYMAEAHSAISEKTHPPSFVPIGSWHLAPGLIALLRDRVIEAEARFSHAERSKLVIVFTAHSLPERILTTNDPYPEQVQATGRAVAESLSAPHYQFAWQSRGRTSEAWLGPDILEKLPELAEQGWRSVLVCPVGFVSDHLEILYDLDIQAAALARSLGIHFERTRSLNDDPAFVKVLADVAGGALAVDPAVEAR